jgi:hypothetical protein
MPVTPLGTTTSVVRLAGTVRWMRTFALRLICGPPTVTCPRSIEGRLPHLGRQLRRHLLRRGRLESQAVGGEGMVGEEGQ